MSEHTEKNLFEVYRENLINMINEMDKARPAYIQSLTNLQQQTMDSMKRLVELTLSVQRDMVEPLRLQPLPDPWLKGSEEFNDAFSRSVSVANKVAISSIDTAVQGIKLATDACEMLTRIGQSMIKSMTRSREGQ